jgi:hypothetical protein
MRRDGEDELDLADIGREMGAATHGASIAGPGRGRQAAWAGLLPAIDSSLKSPVDGKSCRRERRRRNDFDEAVTLLESRKWGK